MRWTGYASASEEGGVILKHVLSAEEGRASLALLRDAAAKAGVTLA